MNAGWVKGTLKLKLLNLFEYFALRSSGDPNTSLLGILAPKPRSETCCAIKTKSWLKITRGFILGWYNGTYIQAGGHSLTEWHEVLMRHYIRGTWILMRWPVSLEERHRPLWWSVYQRDTSTKRSQHLIVKYSFFLLLDKINLMNILLYYKVNMYKKDQWFPVAVQILLIELCFKAYSHLLPTSAFVSSKITEAIFTKRKHKEWV